MKKVLDKLPEGLRNTAFVRLFGLTKVPMIFWLRPTVIELSEEVTAIKIPLSRRSKNHLNSMYFGALACGADLAGGFAAMKKTMDKGKRVSLAFKDFHAEFLKRAEGDTVFTCKQGKEIDEFVDMVLASDERHNLPLKITATCPDVDDGPVAEFTITLSLKRKSKK